MRVLLVKTSSLGDILHAFPVLQYLHQEFPHVKVDWVVEESFSAIVKAHPLVHQVLEIDTKGWRKGLWKYSTWRAIFAFRRELQKTTYDLVIDLQGNTKSALPTFLARSEHKLGFGLKTVHEWPNTWVTHHRFNPPLYLNVRDENLSLAQHYFQRYASVKEEKILLKLNEEQRKEYEAIGAHLNNLPGKKILVCPGSAWQNKQLTKEALQSFLVRLNASLVLAWGSASELKLAQEIQEVLKEHAIILDKVSLPVLQNIMSKMDLVIAMDSLPLHLAGTSGTPTFSVFGASSAQKYKPLGEAHQAFQGVCPYGQVFERRCPILRTCSTGLCIKALSGEDLFNNFLRMERDYLQASSLKNFVSTQNEKVL